MSSTQYVIAVDQGSSGTMVALMDQAMRVVDDVDIPIAASTPAYGYVEHDPFAIVSSIREGAQQLVARNTGCLKQLQGFGIANQGESFLLWDMDTAEPLTPVISWQDTRSEALCNILQQEGRDGWFHEKTGLHLSSEWPALKIKHIMDTGVPYLANATRIAYGQLDAWVLYVLSGGKVFASDHGTASRSGLYNIHTLGWDEELRALFKAQNIELPTLIDNTCYLEGMDLSIGKLLPYVAGGLDQSIALLGLRCVTPGATKVTYGTCCACWMHAGDKPLLDSHLTTSVAWKTKEGAAYALAAEGGASGNIVTWLQQNFHTGWAAAALSDIAASSGGQEQLCFVPAFGGLSAPYWKAGVKGTLYGITTGTAPAHILRAGLDAVAYTVADILSVMPPVRALLADGGMTKNTYLMQKQADVLQRDLIVPAEKEGTLHGIGYLIGLSLGYIPRIEVIAQDQSGHSVISPQAPPEATGYAQWKRAVANAIAYYEHNTV